MKRPRAWNEVSAAVDAGQHREQAVAEISRVVQGIEGISNGVACKGVVLSETQSRSKEAHDVGFRGSKRRLRDRGSRNIAEVCDGR